MSHEMDFTTAVIESIDVPDHERDITMSNESDYLAAQKYGTPAMASWGALATALAQVTGLPEWDDTAFTVAGIDSHGELNIQVEGEALGSAISTRLGLAEPEQRRGRPAPHRPDR